MNVKWSNLSKIHFIRLTCYKSKWLEMTKNESFWSILLKKWLFSDQRSLFKPWNIGFMSLYCLHHAILAQNACKVHDFDGSCEYFLWILIVKKLFLIFLSKNRVTAGKNAKQKERFSIIWENNKQFSFIRLTCYKHQRHFLKKNASYD